MRATGIIRRLDELNRIVLPKAVCKEVEFSEGAALEIFVDGKEVILQRYYPTCSFCEKGDGEIVVGNKNICVSCARELKTAIERIDAKEGESK